MKSWASASSALSSAGRGDVDADKAGPVQHHDVRGGSGALHRVLERLERAIEDGGAHRLRQGDDDRRPRARRIGLQAVAGLRDGEGEVAGTECELDRPFLRAGHGEEQRRGLAEPAVELDRSRALGQAGVDRLQLQVDVVEFLLRILDALVELDLDDGDTRKGERLDTEVTGAGGMDDGALGRCRLHLTGDELLDLLGRSAGPGRHGARDPDGNHRVLELRHVPVAEDAPGDDRDEQDPRDVPVLDEEPGSVVGRLFLFEQLPLAILGLAHSPSY